MITPLVEWRPTEAGGLVPYRDGEEVTWAPQEGGQRAFLESTVFETLAEGNRGGGKTDVLLMSFAQHVGKGFGPEWRGILFRQTYKQLDDVVGKTKKWFRQIFPAATFNESSMKWAWPTGEVLRLGYMERPEDYWNYHGSGYPWIGWEELTTWGMDDCYLRCMSLCRSSHPRVPRMYRSTTNPYGPGHNWVKERFRLPISPKEILGEIVKERKLSRVAVRISLESNRVLLGVEPDYMDKVVEAAGNDAQKKAWTEGNWDVVAGGMFDDLWMPKYHVIPAFDLRQIPVSWRLNRSYDHGQSAPFSVGWWAESNGEPVILPDGRKIGAIRGDLIRVAEWYGWSGKPNVGLRMLSGDIAKGILDRENEMGMKGRFRVGPADSMIFDETEPGRSVAGEMAKVGVRWEPADKRPGSRKHGWDQLRKLLSGAMPDHKTSVREKAGIFISERCTQFIRTVPVLARDERDLDEVAKNAEDHVADEVRYRIRERRLDFSDASF